MDIEEIEFTPLLAVAYAEGFGEGEGATGEQKIQAWAYLIKTKAVWSLQGWFGRTATAFMEQGVISFEGEVNWEVYHELNG